MRRALIIVSSLFLMTLGAYADSPGDAVAAGLRAARTHIAAKEFAEAAAVLDPLFPTASTIPNTTEQNQALAALHFYSAVAYSGMRNDTRAREHLTEFFRLSPNTNRIDPAKYQSRFVTLFNELMPSRVSGDTFETYYPAFESFAGTEKQIDLPGGTWGDSPTLEILATPTEKREWSLLPTAADRARFIAEFWQRRDPSQATSHNEFRDTFERRVAFADKVFGTTEERGATSDRGRVFILLGRPSFVRRRAIRREDVTGRNRIWIDTDAIINGTIEQWVYTRGQLPIPISKPTITYRFVTQPGIGVGVLAKEDAYAMQALNAAMNPKQ